MAVRRVPTDCCGNPTRDAKRDRFDAACSPQPRHTLTRIGAMLVFGACSVSAEAAETSFAQMIHESWATTDADYTLGSVFALAQTRERYLWLGNADGLFRFDGAHFERFENTTVPQMQKNAVSALCVSADNALWIGGRGGLLRMQGEQFERISLHPGGLHEEVRSLHCGADGTVIVGGRNGGIYRRPSSAPFGFRTLRAPAPDRPPVYAVLPDVDGQVLAATFGDGLLSCNDTGCQPVVMDSAESQPRVTALFRDRKDRVWVGSYVNGVAYREGGRWRRHLLRPESGDAVGPVLAISEDRAGDVWVGSVGGVIARIHDDSVEFGGRASDAKTLQSMSMIEDAEGSIWVGAFAGGLHRFRRGHFTPLGASEGVPAAMAWSVFEAKDKTVWISTYGGGIAAFVGGRLVRVYTTADGLPSNDVHTAAEDAQGGLVVGTVKGIARLQGDRFAPIAGLSAVAPGLVAALYTDSTGRTWIGGPNIGLSYLESGQVKHVLPSNGWSGGSAWSFAEGPDRALWIGTSGRGVFRYANGTLTPYGTDQGIADLNIMAVHVDAENTTWVATDAEGVHRIDDGRVSRIAAAQGLPTQRVYGIAGDQSGDLWMTSNVGVLRARRSDLSALHRGETARIDFERFGRDDGLRSDDCTSTVQPAIWIGHDGRVWVPTADGVAVANPGTIPGNDHAPEVRIESVHADDVQGKLGPSLVFDADVRRVRFQFTALSLQAPRKVRFKYRLDGLDQDWVDGGNRRAATFSGLRAGDYTFRVIGANNDGVWNTIGDQQAFTIRAPVHQTPWFYALLAALTLGLGYFAYRSRVSRIEARSALSEERLRIAREFHDTLAQGFTGIFVQLAVAERLTAQGKEGSNAHVVAARSMAEDCLAQSRAAILALRGDTMPEVPLNQTLAEQIRARCVDTDIELDIDVAEDAPRFPPPVAFNLQRLVEEAVSNVVRHARAKHLQVRIEVDRDYRICISDDGCGFDVAKTRSQAQSFGLRGMLERARLAGAQLEIESAQQRGTSITVRLPLPTTRHSP